MDPAGKRFYRILRVANPTQEDFFSHAALGKQPRRTLTVEEAERWRGLSMFDSLRHAVSHQERSPFVGSYLAELRVPEDHGLVARRTTPTPGHWTIWGDANELLAYVVGIIDLTEGGGE